MANSATTDKSKQNTMEKVQFFVMKLQELVEQHKTLILVIATAAIVYTFEQSITLTLLIRETHPTILLTCITFGVIGYRVKR